MKCGATIWIHNPNVKPILEVTVITLKQMFYAGCSKMKVVLDVFFQQQRCCSPQVHLRKA
jgi:hypothetical protein